LVIYKIYQSLSSSFFSRRLSCLLASSNIFQQVSVSDTSRVKMKSPLAFSCNLPKRGPPWKFIFLTIERSKPVTDLSYSPSFRFSVKLVARFSSSHAMTLSFHSLHRIFFFFFFFFLLFFTSPSRESISFLSLFSPRPVRRRRVYSYHMEQFPPSYLRKDIF
jgi:hypothetical protein